MEKKVKRTKIAVDLPEKYLNQLQTESENNSEDNKSEVNEEEDDVSKAYSSGSFHCS